MKKRFRNWVSNIKRKPQKPKEEKYLYRHYYKLENNVRAIKVEPLLVANETSEGFEYSHISGKVDPGLIFTIKRNKLNMLIACDLVLEVEDKELYKKKMLYHLQHVIRYSEYKVRDAKYTLEYNKDILEDIKKW